MITIRQKQTGETQEISVYAWDQNHFNHETWEILKEENIVRVFHYYKFEWIRKHRMEKQDAIDLVKKYPNEYKYEDDSIPEIIGTPRMGFDIGNTISGIDLINKMADIRDRLYGAPAIRELIDAKIEMSNQDVLRKDLNNQPKPTPSNHSTIKYIKSFLSTIIKHPLWSAIIAGLVLYFLTHS